MNTFVKELGRLSFRKENIEKIYMPTWCLLKILTVIYIGIALFFLHSLWYHWLFATVCGMIFGYILSEWYVESDRKKLLRESAVYFEAFVKSCESGEGPERSLRRAAERGSERMKRFSSEVEHCLTEEFYGDACGQMKNSLPIDPLKDFLDILVIWKEKGRFSSEKGKDLFLKAFQQISYSVGKEIVQAEQEDLDSRSAEIWVLLAPFAAVPGTQLLYQVLFQRYFDILSSYKTLESQTVALLIFVGSSLGALFLNWIRKSR